MIIIKNKIIPFEGYSTINLFGILFTKMENLSKTTINHESIHTQQILELFISSLLLLFFLCLVFNLNFLWLLLSPCSFYIWYIIEYLIIRFKHKRQKNAYHDISFEEEAYNNESNLKYLDNRKHFAWLKYLKIRSYVGKQR